MPMKILIVGGGIAGCACAALLKKYDVADVVLIEKAPEFRNIGYLIALWETGRKILRELGVDDAIANKNSFEFTNDIIFDKSGRLLKEVPFELFKKLGPTVIIKRAALHEGLFGLLTGMDIRFNTTVERILQGDGVAIVEMSDGKKETFDLVIGADGIHSSVREKVFGPEYMHHYGWGVWMWWMSNDFAHPKDTVGYYGSGKVCAGLPFFDKAMATAISTVPPGTGHDLVTRRELLQKQFGDFCDDAKKILKKAPSAEEIYYADIAQVDMPLWHKGRVVLIGDAQHAVSPVTGMGASMAMEDASVLVEELRLRPTIDEALVRFASRRDPRIRSLRKIVNRLDGWMMAHGVLGFLRNRILAYIPDSFFINVLHRFVTEKV